MPLILTLPSLASFAASDRDFIARVKNSHLSIRCFSEPGKDAYFFIWSRSAANLANGESGSNFGSAFSRGLL